MLKPQTPHSSVLSGAQSGAGAVNSPAVNTGNYNGFVAYLNVTAHGGTTPTLDVKFQDSSDGGTTWFDIASGSFTQVTTVDGKSRLVVSNVGPKVRAVATLGGTTPAYTFTLDVAGIN